MKYKIIKRRACAWLLAIAMVLTGVNLPVNTKSVAAATASSYSYEPITINKNALNGSTVWGKGDSAFTMDQDGGFFSSDKQADGAFPDNGKIVTNDNVPYQLEWTGSYKYSGNDSIRLTGRKNGNQLTSDKVTMTLSSYGAYDKIYVLGTAGGFQNNTYSLNFSVTLTYTDNSTSTTTYQLYDWYKNTSEIANSIDGYAIYKRLNSNGSSIDQDYGTNGGPMVQSKKIDCDQSKLLKSISFQIANTDASVANENGIYSAIYAVTGAVSQNAPFTPQAKEATGINTSQFTANWEKVDKATGYKLDVSKYKNFCDENGNPSFVSKYNNLSVDGSDMTSYLIEGLDRNATYYYRVRAVGDGGQSMSSNVITVKTLDQLKEVTLLNDSYPYGKNMSTSSVTLAVDVNEKDSVGSYQWQYAPEKETAEADWVDISDKEFSSDHSDQIELRGDTLKDGYWYRCVVNGLTTSKPVQLVKANGSTMTNVTRPYTYGQWYVSNTYVSYTSAAGGYFDVLGKYEKNNTYYWLQTSYYGGWRMYTNTSESPSASSYYSGSCSLDKLRVAFDGNDNFNMKFDAVLANGQKSFAFGCDTMLGNWITSGSYSDYASLKSIKEDDNVKQIQMVGAYSVDTAKATDTSFVLKYVDGYAPTYYWLGRYYSRQVWTQGTLEDVINTDSGMTSSWCNVANGNVKFEFHVGAVADTGARITICATSGKDSITIQSPNSSCEYALYQVVDGEEQVVSGWQKISGNSHTYGSLTPNTKYILKAKKDGEIVTSEIYTRIDTETGADENVNSGKIQSNSTSSTITLSNLKNTYEYALTDARGNIVAAYKTPLDHSLTFSNLCAGTTYYLIARSGENNLSEKVTVRTQNAKISFDKNSGDDNVTGMPNTVTKTYGTPVTLPSAKPVRTGYKFAGWTIAAYKDKKAVFYRAGSRYYGESDAALYAVWYDQDETIDEDAAYNVQYNGNVSGESVTGIPSTGTKQWGTPYVLSEMLPSREGYTFQEWNTSSDGTGTSYQPGEAYLLNADVTLYAVWNVKQQQITVETSDRYTSEVTGDTVTSDGLVNYGKDAVVTITAKDGYDIHDIEVQANGEKVEGSLSEDQKSYTISLSNIKEDRYITVSGIIVDSIALDQSSYDFGSLVEYYAKVPTAAVITVNNDGETGADVTLEQQPISDKKDSAFVIGKVEKTALVSGEKTTFTVQPKKDLPVGVYTENITVKTTTGAKQSVTVSFEVKKDTTPPTGEISFAEKKWTSLLQSITFGMFFKNTLQVKISGQDEENGSGLDKVYYYIADQEMTQEELEKLSADNWIEGTECSISPNQKAVVYAKLTDRGGNAAYLSSDGVVVDDVAPVIKGIKNQEELYIEKSYPVQIEELHLDKVYVTSGTALETAADEVEITNGAFVLTSKTEGARTITAVDKSGNQSSLQVNFVSLNDIKSAAKEEIQKKAEEAKKKIDQLEDLTEEEKAKAAQEVEEETAKQLEAVENAENREKVTEGRKTAKAELEKEQNAAVAKDLENAKNTASKEIDQKAEEARKAIDALTDLSEEEKAEAKKAIDKQAEETKAEIAKVTDPADKKEVSVNKDSANAEIQKEQTKAENQDLSNAKASAVKEIDQKAQEAKEAIDQLTELSEKEKQEAKNDIDKKTEETKKAVENVSDPADKKIVEDSSETTGQEIQSIHEKAAKTDLGYAKDKAVDEITKNAEKAKAVIDQLEDLTEEEKKKAKEEVDQKAEAAKEEITSISDPANKKDVSDHKDSVNAEIQTEQKKAEDQDLNNAKALAEEEIDQKAETARKAIDALEDLTPEEKENAKAEISKKAEESKAEIAKVTDPASKSAVSANKDSVNAEIQTEQKKAEDQDLSNAKESALKELDQQIENALLAVDRLTNLTEEEKNAAKEKIKSQVEEAKSNIQNTTEKSEVKNTEITISTDVAEKVDTAKKKDYTKTKDDKGKGMLTVMPDSEQTLGSEKKYSVSLRVGNTEVEKKSSVAAGETVSFDKIPDGIYNLVVSDGENECTTYVQIKEGTAAEIGKISLSSKNTSVDVKMGAPDIAVSGLEGIFNTDVFKTNKDAVKVIEEGSGKVDMKLTADNADDEDGTLTAALPNGKTTDRFAELLADMIITDASGQSQNYNLNDIQIPVLIAMPLSAQEKNRTGYVLYRKHNNGKEEQIEQLPMLDGNDITEKPDYEGFYVDQDYVYIWAQKFSVYALAYDEGSTAPTPAPSETPAVPGRSPAVPSETPIVPGETTSVPGETPVIPSATPGTSNETQVLPSNAPDVTPAVTAGTSAAPGETPAAPAATKAAKKPSKTKDQSKLSGNEIDKLKLPLLLAQGKGGNQKITLNWTKLSKTAGYECYWSYCDGKKLFRKFASTKNGKAQAVHKKLKNNRKYKYFVVAYKMVDGNKIYTAKSPQLHIAMKADKQTNVLKLDVNAAKVTLNKGKTFHLECRSTLENAKKKQVLHAKEYRYYTSNSKVASVDANGTIKAVADGTCKITVIANNGVYREIKMTVSKTAKVTKEKKLVAEGTRFTDKATNAVYEITSLTGKTVALAGISDKNMKELEAAKTVKYDGTTYRVTSIAEKAFLGNKTLQSVVLHDGIQSVGKSAFQNCKNLDKLTIYSTKWKEGSIGKNALKGISSKVHVYCKESVWEKYEALVEKANIPKGKMINLIEK